jgi:histidine decarboxylase
MPLYVDISMSIIPLGQCLVGPPRTGAVQPVLAVDDSAEIGRIFRAYSDRLAERHEHHLGYPFNFNYDVTPLHDAGLDRFLINNVGDPFVPSNYGIHSREFELGVIDWFGELWRLPKEDRWGYVTCSGTEGNFQGILLGREALPDGVLYASGESHYSIFKAARMFRMDAVRVAADPETGEMDYEDLRAHLAASERPAIINVNVGTTVRGAIDDLDRVIQVLEECGYVAGRDFYIHCDAALFGMILPFLSDDGTTQRTPPPSPLVSFEKPIGSISVSGHKFLGAPAPCGIVLARFGLVEALTTDVEYINSRDTTIMGSRNGHAALYMWHALSTRGLTGLQRDADRCVRVATQLREWLEAAGVRASLNARSNTVVFERPKSEALVKKWQLACECDIAHVVVMPSVREETLREFVRDIQESSVPLL